MTVLGIVAALPGEARALGLGRRARSLDMPVSLARTDAPVWVSVSGMGPGRARASALALRERNAGALLSFGCAAGLDPRLPPGALVVPQRLSHAQGSATAVTGQWHAGLCLALAGSLDVHTSALAAAQALLESSSDKRALGEASGAAAADMESAAVAEVALDAGLPFIAVRAVADDATMSIPLAARAAAGANGRIRPGASLRALVANPRELAALTALGRAFCRACATLALVAASTGRRFALD
ncbi:MAG: purine phosphorylase [Gammaproteobacteria bacterium]